MRCLLACSSYKLKLTSLPLRRAKVQLNSPPVCSKFGHLYYATITSKPDGSSIHQNRVHDVTGHAIRYKGAHTQQIWQARLKTFKQLGYESDLDSHPREGPRLVDINATRHNHDVWLELLLYRRRVHGVKGMIPVWQGMMKRNVPLADHPSVPTIWSLLLELGYSDHFILHQVCTYAENTYVSTGYKFPNLYVGIIRHLTSKKESWLIERWHERLRDMFPPTTEHFCELFSYLNQPETPSKLSNFMRKAYEELSIQGVYAFIVTTLCKAKSFQAALEWHHFLIEHKDFPATSESTDQIFEYLSLTKNSEQTSKVTKDLLDAGVRFVPKNSRKLYEHELLTKEAMNLLHSKHHGIPPKELSDDFCARLFATRFFSIENTVRGLEILGTQAIGPKALRELMARTLDSEKTDSRLALSVLQQLSAAGISIGRSVFARVVKELATNHKADILYDVVTCDMHCEAFEDRMLQESLLHHYCKTGDEKGIQRTLAILLVDTQDNSSRQCRSWNYVLRSAINNRDWKGISRVLNSMEELKVKATSRSYEYMLQRLISTRQAGKLPSTTANDLDPLINIWQSVMRKGGTIPVSLWSELLCRLGMNGFLHEYEKLALWLTTWFAMPSFRSSQMSVKAMSRLLKNSTKSTDPVTTCTMVRKHDPRHPLRQLFPNSAIQAIVAWGFQHESSEHSDEQFVMSEHMEADSSPCAQWTWGLRLLCRLQALGLRVYPITLGKACEIRLIGIFGKGLSGRPRNRDVQARHSRKCIEQYLSSMEEIMGEDLFRGIYPQTFGMDKDARRQAIGRLIKVKAERLARKSLVIRPRRLKDNMYRYSRAILADV